MTRMTGTGLIAAVLAVAPLLAQKPEAAETLLQAAIKKEVVDGDLHGAIKQYAAIAAKYKSDRAVTAVALVHMAECYQKMGDVQARKIYEQVVRDYADQKEAASQAKAHLDAVGLTKPAVNGAMTVRMVWGRGADNDGTISRDGRYLPCTQWGNGDLAIKDLLSGEVRLLTKNPKGAREFADLSVLSPDNNKIVFAWETDHGYELRLINFDGTGNRVLYADPQYRNIEPMGWSPDGKIILVQISLRGALKHKLVLISASDGSVRTLRDFDVRPQGFPRFSPDGRYVAFAEPIPARLQVHLHIMKVPSEQEPAQEWTVEENASNSQFVAWSPDGHNLLFTSDRSGSWDLWRLPIENGKAKSEAVLVRRAFGQIQPMGMTSQGGLYYWTTNFASDVYTAAIEPETGKLLREPKLASERYVGSNCCATWSPDGKYLAFRSQPGAGQGQAQPVIVTLDLATGKRHETYVQWPNFRTPKWSPDGKEFLITTNLVINRVNSETGEVTPVVKNTGESTLLWSQWTPDGKSIIYSNRTTLFVRDVASGIDREIYRRPGAGEPMIFNPTISSDGRSIAFLRGGDLCLIPVAGGEPRVLHQAEPLSIVREGGMAWTPDSKMLLVVRAIRKNPASWERTSELWRIPVDGGEPAKTELSTPGMTDISLNADGKTLAFSASQRWGEVWVLENFLPKLSAAR